MIKEWTVETENAFDNYCLETDAVKRNEIYDNELGKHLKALVDYICHKGHYSSLIIMSDNLKKDLLADLILSINVHQVPINKIKESGKPFNRRIYCEVIVRSNITNYYHKYKKNGESLSFTDWYKSQHENI